MEMQEKDGNAERDWAKFETRQAAQFTLRIPNIHPTKIPSANTGPKGQKEKKINKKNH